MNAIKFITTLLIKAYEAEAERLRKHAAKLGKLQAKRALEAVDLAAAADEAREESVELGEDKRHNEDKAVSLLKRREEVAEFFLGKE